jgi:prefoldin subunit 5
MSEQNSFIVKCVLGNVSLPSSTRVGVGQNYTVQDLANAQVSTLQNIGKNLEVAIKNHGGSQFEEQSELEIPSSSGVTAREWIDYIVYLIKRKKEYETASQKRREIEALRRELDNLKTPAERRKELQATLAQYESETATT